MGARRTNITIIALILVLAGRLGLRDRDEADEARPRPQRRHPAHLPGRAERREPDRRPARTSTGRSRSSATASTRSASPSRRSPRSGPIRSRSASRTSRTPSGRSTRSATPRSSTSTTSSRTSSRSTRRSTEVTPTNLNQQATTSLYDAVELASKQNTKCNDVCTTTGPELYLFEKKSREYVAGPESSKRDLFSTDEAKAVPKDDQKIFSVPQGTIVVEDQQDDTERDAALLRPPRQAAAQRRRHHQPRAELRPEQPAERHLRLHRRGPGRVPEHHPADRPARPGVARAAVLVRDRPRPRDRLAAGHRLPGEPGRDRRPHRRADLRRLHDPAGPGPRDVPEDRRAAGRPEADQPEHGHGDARPAGARRRASRRA